MRPRTGNYEPGSSGSAGDGYRVETTAPRRTVDRSDHAEPGHRVSCPTDGVTRVCGCCRPTTRTDRTLDGDRDAL